MDKHNFDKELNLPKVLEREPCSREDCEVRRIAAELQKEIAQRRVIEARLADAQRIAHVGHWDWNIVTNDLVWSDEVYRIFGLHPQEFGATYPAFLDRVHPADRDFVIRSVNCAVFEHAVYTIDHRVVRPNGEVRIVHEQGEVSFDHQGKACRMLGTVQDVTESRMVSLELARKGELLRRVLEALPVGVWIADETGGITATNEAASEIWGDAPHLALADYEMYQGWDLKSGQRLRSEDWAMSRALITRKPYIGQEAKIRTFDGRDRVIRTSAVPLMGPRDKLAGGIAVAEDITSQFLAEQALSRAGEELRKLTQHQIRLREREKAMFAHELHEGIGQLLSAALMQVASVRNHIDLTEEVLRKCQAMEGVLKEAIEAVRRLSSELRPPLLDHFGLKDALEFLTKETENTRGITCTLSVFGELPDTDDVRTLDLFRICQEAINRASHANATVVALSVRQEGSGIRLQVQDNGAPLDRECDATSELAVLAMRERTTEMGGVLEVESDPDQGSVITASIPNLLTIR